MDHRLSVRSGADDRAARRRLILLLLRSGDIGALAAEERTKAPRPRPKGAAQPEKR